MGLKPPLEGGLLQMLTQWNLDYIEPWLILTDLGTDQADA
ncbi:hypothetical protein NIES3974_24700 [Calothrix sp. NIES-3974]|nr:hypothetical protein NIES3974_24700 [Calothrix sp. NIES-3974]